MTQPPFPKNTWYVVCTPDEIEDKPLGRTICNEPIVLFRGDEGRVAAVEDFCPHRGAPLSLGFVRDGKLVCGYHGLEMGCDGKCAGMPGQRVRGFPSIRAYPVVERHGFVWLWPGDPEQADPSLIPELHWANSPDWAYGGTFLIFTDYCRPSIRLAALSGLRVIYVMTHDSIGLGEDGPTHQPVEQLASLRAMPNLHVFRPADAVETAECWAQALSQKTTPSVIALSRQGVAPVRHDHVRDNLCARGGYVLAEADGKRRATLLSSGTEVALALAARDTLQADGINTAVVSMPCWELFDKQGEAYRDHVLGPGTVRVAVEAAVMQGWDRYVGDNGATVGMTGFGASAPAGELYEHFGITADAVVAAVMARL